MKRPYNFSAGPAMLPLSILEEAQAELLDWQGLGCSVMEIGHRTQAFQDLLSEAEVLLRELLAIPSHYHVLFLGGAARTHFSMIPMNFIAKNAEAGYLVSGIWSSLAYQEAARLSNAYCAAGNAQVNSLTAPTFSPNSIRPGTSYLYFTPNETVNGVRFAEIPKTVGVPLIADMTSCLLSEPIDVSDYALIFAGAQKNIAPAGLTVVILHPSLLANTPVTSLPTMMDYRTHVRESSLYATPPVFQCYMAHKMFRWIKASGGVSALYRINTQKAKALYDYIDASSAYHCAVEKTSRSLTNVCFSIVQEGLEQSFLAEAERSGLLALKGHRTVGGLRASLYNAMPMSGVLALIEFMQQFAMENKL